MTQARRSRSSGYSFGTLNAILFLSIMIPILVVVGLVVYGLQQQFLVSSTRDRLKAFVESGVAATPMDPPNLSRLAVSLGERLRILDGPMVKPGRTFPGAAVEAGHNSTNRNQRQRPAGLPEPGPFKYWRSVGYH
jgi:hypothetical protein